MHPRSNPKLLFANTNGEIFDAPDLLMLCRKGAEWALPRLDELIPLPPESEFFLLPKRHALGLDKKTGKFITLDEVAVAAFAAPAYTLSAHPAYIADSDAPLLPLFAYGAVGFAEGKIWICAQKVDQDERQQFRHIPLRRIEDGAKRLLSAYPYNRLLRHILDNCVSRYACPAARNLALGRFEAPLPSSRACNARCLGCISAQSADSPLRHTPQCRLDFTPKATEIAEIMRLHQGRERRQPIYSFGQGCEGEPLSNPELLLESVRLFRAEGIDGKPGRGTINLNSNASRPEVIGRLAHAGLTSLRVSLNSARPELYERYYRPCGYSFADVRQSVRVARSSGLFVSLNLLFFPGMTDTEAELAALAQFVGENGVSMIQWRNLNIDPDWYLKLLGGELGTESANLMDVSPRLGLGMFMKRLKKLCPWLRYGYFNPYLGDTAKLSAPLPGKWSLPES